MSHRPLPRRLRIHQLCQNEPALPLLSDKGMVASLRRLIPGLVLVDWLDFGGLGCPGLVYLGQEL